MQARQVESSIGRSPCTADRQGGWITGMLATWKHRSRASFVARLAE